MPDYKALLQEMIDQVWNPEREPAVDRYYAADFRSHDPDEPAVTSREDLGQAALGIFAAFPDFQVTITDMVAEGDRVAKRFVCSGTHKGVRWIASHWPAFRGHRGVCVSIRRRQSSRVLVEPRHARHDAPARAGVGAGCQRTGIESFRLPASAVALASGTPAVLGRAQP